jgi:hypothetical protein
MYYDSEMEMVVIYNLTDVTAYNCDTLQQFKSTRSFLPTASIENGNTSSSVTSTLPLSDHMSPFHPQCTPCAKSSIHL